MQKTAIVVICALAIMLLVAAPALSEKIPAPTGPQVVPLIAQSSCGANAGAAVGRIRVVEPQGDMVLILNGRVTELEADMDYLASVNGVSNSAPTDTFSTNPQGKGRFQFKLRADELSPEGSLTLQITILKASANCIAASTDPFTVAIASHQSLGATDDDDDKEPKKKDPKSETATPTPVPGPSFDAQVTPTSTPANKEGRGNHGRGNGRPDRE